MAKKRRRRNERVKDSPGWQGKLETVKDRKQGWSLCVKPERAGEMPDGES